MKLKRTTKHSKSIIRGKLYDTSTAEAILWFSPNFGESRCLFKTLKGNYFSAETENHSYIDDVGDSVAELAYTDIQPETPERAQEIIGRYDPEKYMDMFGFVEDA